MCVWCWPDRARAHCEAIRRLKELLVTPRSALPVPRHHRPQCRGTERCSRASLKPLLGPPVDQQRLRAAHRVCPVVSRIKPDFLDPGIDDVGVLPGSQRASLGKQALARSRVTHGYHMAGGAALPRCSELWNNVCEDPGSGSAIGHPPRSRQAMPKRDESAESHRGHLISFLARRCSATILLIPGGGLSFQHQNAGARKPIRGESFRASRQLRRGDRYH